MKGRRALVAVITLAMGAGLVSPAVAATPHVALSSQLRAVTCSKPTNCFAVGELAPTSGSSNTLVVHWNGTAWSIVPSPSATGADFSRLYGVSCSSTTSCFAVGQQFVRSTSLGKTLVERWNGKTWSIVPSPNPSTPKISSELHAVSCVNASSCIAVGLQLLDPSTCCSTLIERWNGKTWSIMKPPTVAGAGYSRLDAVTCTSASKCFAVGYYSINGRTSPLVERWSGTTWSIVPSPNPEIGEGGWFASVACTAATNCVAAGAYSEGGAGRPASLIEQWNGKTWSIVNNPNPVRSYNELNGVACFGTSSCMTVGEYYRPGAPKPYYFLGSRTVIQRWNGKHWSIVASPNGSVYNVLAGVACPATTTCFAVGNSASNGGPTGMLVERWNGTAWSVVSTPAP